MAILLLDFLGAFLYIILSYLHGWLSCFHAKLVLLIAGVLLSPISPSISGQARRDGVLVFSC